MGRNKLTLKEMQIIAKSRGGKCLSKEYVNANANLLWQCKKGHKWHARPHNIKNGTWCRKCFFNSMKLTIDDMQNIAAKNEGKCLSNKYSNSRTKLIWQCKHKHIWQAKPLHIVKGHWCPYCSGRARLTIKEMNGLAKLKGGHCLSKKYINANANLKWKCKERHIWWASPHSIKRGQWCPICSTGVSERICRKYFELIFHKHFPKLRPNWLVNSRGNIMELDGYCKELGLAFEYQGHQHYILRKHFHTKRTFQQRKEDDKTKRTLCKRKGIVLIEVPYLISYDKLYEYIIHKCRKHGIKVNNESAPINYLKFDVYSPQKIRIMQAIAKLRGGKCLSTHYVNDDIKLIWQCKKGHIWKAKPNTIKNGHWCLICSGMQQHTIKELKNYAINQWKGRCLSIKYINAHSKLEWQCKNDHTWFASANTILRGHWCPYCANLAKLTILEMNNIAKSRYGKCLSKRYVNSRTKLKWLCSKGHIWQATPNNIKNGSWCPKCKNVKD